MKSYKQYKAEFDKECPDAYPDWEIKEMYFFDIVEPAVKQGVKLSKEFIKKNVSKDKIWWLNKHFYHDNQIV